MKQEIYDRYCSDINNFLRVIENNLEEYASKFNDYLKYFHNIQLSQCINWLDLNSYKNLLPIDELSYMFFIINNGSRIVKKYMLEFDNILHGFVHLYKINKVEQYISIRESYKGSKAVIKMLDSLSYFEIEEYINCLLKDEFNLKLFLDRPRGTFLQIQYKV